MFGGIVFMVGGKMFLTASSGRMMCRIGPDIHEAAIKRKGCRTVIMGGREYVYVNEDSLQEKAAFDYWIELALAFNQKVQALGILRLTKNRYLTE